MEFSPMVPVVTPNVLLLQSAALAAASAESVIPPESSKPRVWPVFLGWILALLSGTAATFICFIMLGLTIGVVVGFQGGDAAAIQARYQAALANPLLALLLTLVPFQLGMAAFVLLAARRSKEPIRERIGLIPASGQRVGIVKLASLAGFTLSTALATVIGLTLLMGAPAANVIGNAINQDSLLAITVVSILLSLVPAIVEEVVFRGFIQRRLLQRWSPKVAIAVSTLLFALMHCDSLHHVITVIPLGIVTGLLAYRTGSVKAGIVVHALHNGGLVVIFTALRMLEPAIGQEAVGMLMIGGGLTMLLAGGLAVVSLLRKDRTVEADHNPFALNVEASLGQAA